MSSFYTCVPKITIVWCVLLEICSVRDIILSFWGIFCTLTPLTTKKIKTFCPFFAFLPPPPPPNRLKNQNFEKIKKPGDIIILHIMCTKNYDHMMYCFWDLVCDRRTKRQTHKRMKKWHTEVGAPPKNLNLKDCIRPMLH